MLVFIHANAITQNSIASASAKHQKRTPEIALWGETNALNPTSVSRNGIKSPVLTTAHYHARTDITYVFVQVPSAAARTTVPCSFKSLLRDWCSATARERVLLVQRMDSLHRPFLGTSSTDLRSARSRASGE